MASSKMQALTEIARVVVSLAAGYLIYYAWDLNRPYDPQYYSVAAGVVVAMLFIILLRKVSKGGGG